MSVIIHTLPSGAVSFQAFNEIHEMLVRRHANTLKSCETIVFLVCYLPLLPCQEVQFQFYLRTSVPLTSVFLPKFAFHSSRPDFVHRII